MLVPVCQDMENRPVVNDPEDGYGVTLHVPALTPSSARVTLFNFILRGFVVKFRF